MAQNNVFCAKPSDTGWPLLISSGGDRRRCASVCFTVKETGESAVWVESCAPSTPSPAVMLTEFFGTKFAKLCLRPSSVRSPLALSRTVDYYRYVTGIL